MSEYQEQNLGWLDSKSSLIYRTCWNNPFSTPTSIARHTKLPRSTVHFHLAHLQQKNLVGVRVTKRKKLFFALSLKKAFSLHAKEQKEKLEKEREAVQALAKKLPQTPLRKQGVPSISSLEEETGILYAIEKILTEKKDIFWAGSLNPILATIGEDLLYKEMTIRRLKQNTKSYAITSKTILANKRIGEEIGNFRNYSFIHEELIPNGMFLLCGKITVLFSELPGKKVRSTIIEDSSLSKILMSFFQILWNNTGSNSSEETDSLLRARNQSSRAWDVL